VLRGDARRLEFIDSGERHLARDGQPSNDGSKDICQTRLRHSGIDEWTGAHGRRQGQGPGAAAGGGAAADVAPVPGTL
jgi:hypothetical protein